MTVPTDEQRLIKRYANRKLYDTRESRYVTLQEIAEMVREGQDVKIIDNKSKEDLTRVTLAQIIYEEEKKGDERRTLNSLRTFVQEGRDRIQESRERIITSLRDGPMGKLIQHKDEHAEDEAHEVAEGAAQADVSAAESAAVESAEPEAAKMQRIIQGPKDALDELQRMADDRVKSIVAGAMGTVQQLQGEVKRLQTRIEELETRLLRKTDADPDVDSDDGKAGAADK